MAEFLVIATDKKKPLKGPIWELLVEAASAEEALAVGKRTYQLEVSDPRSEVAFDAISL